MDSTTFGPIPNKVTFKAMEGSSKGYQVVKMKSISNPKVVVDKDIFAKTFSEKSRKSGSKTAEKDVTKKSAKDRGSEETKDEIFRNDDVTFHNSPREDATVESNIEEIRNLDVTVNASNVDTNINFGEPIITLLPEKTNVIRP
ncbi:unnamed protein product [Lactuca saligna]|uniref:Uncharacterized protein n=1 Tax=Lactuca saligna TaxID=75948 RepID=A0AA35UXI9_LACSI|nr:unnamed protein product [Lactuca saligna]